MTAEKANYPIIFRYSNNLPIIFDFERHPFNIIAASTFKLNSELCYAVVIKCKCGFKETKTNHVID
jgi:hypothetical protein